LNGFPPDFYTIEVKGKDIKANEKK